MSFDPSQPFETVAEPPSEFDPEQPFEPVDGGPEAWKPLFSGLDSTEGITPEQKESLDYVSQRIDPEKETRAQAINQAFIHRSLPAWHPLNLQDNWPAVREAYAKEVKLTNGEPITDTALYGHIVKSLDQQIEVKKVAEEFAQSTPFQRVAMLMRNFPEYFASVGETAAPGGKLTKENKASWWLEMNKPFADIPAAPDMPDLPGLGPNNPAIIAGVWNSVLKPAVEGLETPLGVGTVGVGGAANVGVPLAKQALTGIAGLFTGLMVKGLTESGPEAAKVLRDPKATTQDKVEAVGTVTLEALFGILGAFHVVTEVAPNLKPTAKAASSPQEAAKFLREEANASPEAKVVDALNEAATKLEELPVVETPETKAKAAAEKVEATQTPKQEKTVKSEPAEASARPEKPIPVSEVEKAYSIKKEALDKDLRAMGEEPTTKGDVISDEMAAKKAAETLRADPEAGMKLVDSLMEEPRAVSHNDVTLLQFENVRLQLKRERLEAARDAAIKAGDDARVAELTEQVKIAREDIKNTADVIREHTSGQGRAFRALQLAAKEDYTLATMEREFTERAGGKLEEAQASEIKALSQRISETEAKFAEYRERMSELLMSDEAPSSKKAPKEPNKVLAKLSEQANAARERIKARIAEGRVQSGLDPADLADHAIIGAEHIVKGAVKFADWSKVMLKEFGDRVKPHLSAIWEKASKEEGAKEAIEQSAKKAEETRLKSFKTRQTKAVEEFRRRIADNDFSPKAKREALKLDEEARQIQAQADLLKKQYRQMLEKAEYDRMSLAGKAGRAVTDLYDAGRTIRATGEFSFIGRQGAFSLAAHPIRTVKAIPETLRSFASNPEKSQAINLRTLNNPRMAEARKSGLHIMDENSSLNHKEELFASRMVGKIPGIRRFDQAATTFLNRIRFESWDAMTKATNGSPEAQAAVAKYVNESTGRGSLGGFEKSAVAMARLMFSPRFFFSRLQYLAGHSLWDAPRDAQRVILREYVRTAAGMSAFYAMQTMYFEMMSDDGEEGVLINTDPKSSDFLKIRVGDTRLDPLAGIQQIAVLVTRLLSGEMTTTSGKEVPIRGNDIPYGGRDAAGLVGNFARGKLHPTAGDILNVLSGKNIVGEEVTPASVAKQALVPMTYPDIIQAYEEHDIPEATNMALSAMLGVGLNTYEAKSKDIKPVPR